MISSLNMHLKLKKNFVSCILTDVISHFIFTFNSINFFISKNVYSLFNGLVKRTIARNNISFVI